jgi:NAD(P)-dependent dehydrogenase (short-subunit alcohol dehydrogenase family)
VASTVQSVTVADQTFKDRHVLVTGAGTGIGAAIAAAFAHAGARVSLVGRRREPLLATQASLAAAQTHVVGDFDVTDESKVRAGVASAREKFGTVEILVNNAGEAPSAPLVKTDLATWDKVLAVNLTGTFLVTREVVPDMIARRAGRVVNIASTAGLVGYAYVSAYVAAKHGVIGLTRSLALEFARAGVTVNAVCPGYTETPLFEKALDNITAKTKRSRDDARATLATTNPQGRLVTPDEVADAVLWLASPGAHAINGQAVAVAGGEVMVG